MRSLSKTFKKEKLATLHLKTYVDFLDTKNNWKWILPSFHFNASISALVLEENSKLIISLMHHIFLHIYKAALYTSIFNHHYRFLNANMVSARAPKTIAKRQKIATHNAWIFDYAYLKASFVLGSHQCLGVCSTFCVRWCHCDIA